MECQAYLSMEKESQVVMCYGDTMMRFHLYEVCIWTDKCTLYTEQWQHELVDPEDKHIITASRISHSPNQDGDDCI